MKDFLLNLFFPKFCLNCKKEGNWLCYDCFSLIGILNKTYCPFCHPAKIGKTCFQCSQKKSLDILYAAVPFNDFIIKKIESQFKKNHLKDLAPIIASIITTHLYLCNGLVDKNSILIPFSCSLKEKKRLGFNPSLEIAKELSKLFKIRIGKKVKNKKVFLVNDIFEEKMDDFAQKLKQKGAKKVSALTLIRS